MGDRGRESESVGGKERESGRERERERYWDEDMISAGVWWQEGAVDPGKFQE